MKAALKSMQHKKESGHPYGLKPVDYTNPPPIFRSPPPPPHKPSSKFIVPFTVFFSLGVTSYFYFYNKNDAYEYWDAMQSGGILPDLLDDDDDDDDDDDEHEVERVMIMMTTTRMMRMRQR